MTRKQRLHRGIAVAVAAALIVAAGEVQASEADDNRDGKLDAAEFTRTQTIHDRLAAGDGFFEDSVITAKIKAALLKDPAVSALAVSVETRKGTVVLSGVVESESQVRRAEEIAAGVQGVVNV